MPQAYNPLPYEADHIIAEQHGGTTDLLNLALACTSCNKRKGPNVGGYDPLTKKLVPLYNPRTQNWRRHFRWEGPVLVGRTRIGRVTIAVLGINSPDYVEFRKELMNEGLFPPKDE
jgi:HNH endonuclease